MRGDADVDTDPSDAPSERDGACPDLEPFVWPARSRHRRRHARPRAVASRVRLVGVGLSAVTVALTVGGTAFTVAQPGDRAVASVVERDLLIVAQPASADDDGPPRSTSAGFGSAPQPVAGLSRAAMDNAIVIIEVGRQLDLPRRAYVVAVATALQETGLRNLANASVSESLNRPHQGVSHNFDSVGLFQQRPSQGWGTAAELMDPATAARLFYRRLVAVSGWQEMSIGAAAQAVQRSAFPGAYDKQRVRAEQIVDAVV